MTPYDKYLNCLVEIIEHISQEKKKQSEISQDERSKVSEKENEYMRRMDELKKAEVAVRQQYQSVWESCTNQSGLRRPMDQRPVETPLNWLEAVKIQEQFANKIRNWFNDITQRAIIERQKKIQEEQKRREELIAAKILEEKRRAEEVARLERERGEVLLEEMKRKYKKRH